MNPITDRAMAYGQACRDYATQLSLTTDLRNQLVDAEAALELARKLQEQTQQELLAEAAGTTPV